MRGTKPRTTRPQVPPIDLPPLDATFDTPPPDLDGDDVAQAEWRRILPTLRSGGVVTALDVSLLIALTQQWSRYREAHQQVRRLGLDAPAAKTYLRLADKALRHYRDLWRELRLTPSMSIGATTPPKPVSRWDGLLPPS
jgi:P27 family predicted phage terminase small subunit